MGSVDMISWFKKKEYKVKFSVFSIRYQEGKRVLDITLERLGGGDYDFVAYLNGAKEWNKPEGVVLTDLDRERIKDRANSELSKLRIEWC